MVNEWGIKKLGLDFMGYTLEKGDIYTYHHIIKRENGGPMTLDNGAICVVVPHTLIYTQLKIEILNTMNTLRKNYSKLIGNMKLEWRIYIVLMKYLRTLKINIYTIELVKEGLL